MSSSFLDVFHLIIPVFVSFFSISEHVDIVVVLIYISDYPLSPLKYG